MKRNKFTLLEVLVALVILTLGIAGLLWQLSIAANRAARNAETWELTHDLTSAAEYLLTSFTGAPLVSGDLRDLPEETGKRIGKFTEAFHALADRECLTVLEVVFDEDDLDVFIRRGESGHGFLCGFNRRKEDVVLDIPTPFACRNVETGETGVHLPAESCGMFIF